MTPKRLTWFLLIFITALIVLGLASCSTSKKFKSTTQIKVDSAVEKQQEAAQVKTIDSTAAKTKDSSFENKIVINFDNAPQVANDYEDAPAVTPNTAGKKVKPPHGPYHYKLGDNDIDTDLPIKSIEIKTNGKVSSTDFIQVKGKDSSVQKQNETTSLHKNVTTTVKNKSSSHLPFYVWIIIILALLATGYYLARKYKLI